MKVLHINAGNEIGGGMHHILLLLNELPRKEIVLGVLEQGELAERAKKLGINVVLFEQKSRKDFSVIGQITNYIEQNQIDIIHTHGPRANLYGTFIAKKSKCKWITTVHSDPRDDFLGKGLKGKVFTYLNIWSIKKSNHLLAISDRFREMLMSFKIQEAKITTILNGIDFKEEQQHLYTREDFKLDADDFVIIMVARMEKVKDHLTALQAVQLAKRQYPKMKMILVGDGAERAYIEEKVEALGLAPHIQFLGQRNDVIELFPLADVCLLTSKSESFPLVLLEAARASIPCISTNVGGIDKMIPTPELGWIREVADVTGIGEALREAAELKLNTKLQEVGEQFEQHCRSRFSIENQATQINEIYREIVLAKN